MVIQAVRRQDSGFFVFKDGCKVRINIRDGRLGFKVVQGQGGTLRVVTVRKQVRMVFKDHLAEIVVIHSGFREFRVKSKARGVKAREFKAREFKSRQGQGRILFNTVFITEVILEGHNVAPPIDRGVVFLKPVNTKDDGVVLELGDIQGHGFMVVFDGQIEGGLVCDGAVDAGRAISHVHPNRVVQGRGGKLVQGGEGRIDKGFLGSRVNKGEGVDRGSMVRGDGDRDTEADTGRGSLCCENLA